MTMLCPNPCYMSTHVLLNLLNKLGKTDKMLSLLSILSLFRNKFNKFNNTGALISDSIYMTMLCPNPCYMSTHVLLNLLKQVGENR